MAICSLPVRIGIDPPPARESRWGMVRPALLSILTVILGGSVSSGQPVTLDVTEGTALLPAEVRAHVETARGAFDRVDIPAGLASLREAAAMAPLCAPLQLHVAQIEIDHWQALAPQDQTLAGVRSRVEGVLARPGLITRDRQRAERLRSRAEAALAALPEWLAQRREAGNAYLRNAPAAPRALVPRPGAPGARPPAARAGSSGQTIQVDIDFESGPSGTFLDVSPHVL